MTTQYPILIDTPVDHFYQEQDDGKWIGVGKKNPVSGKVWHLLKQLAQKSCQCHPSTHHILYHFIQFSSTHDAWQACWVLATSKPAVTCPKFQKNFGSVAPQAMKIFYIGHVITKWIQHLTIIAMTIMTFQRHEEPCDAWLNWSKWYSILGQLMLTGGLGVTFSRSCRWKKCIFWGQIGQCKQIWFFSGSDGRPWAIWTYLDKIWKFYLNILPKFLKIFIWPCHL